MDHDWFIRILFFMEALRKSGRLIWQWQKSVRQSAFASFIPAHSSSSCHEMHPVYRSVRHYNSKLRLLKGRWWAFLIGLLYVTPNIHPWIIKNVCTFLHLVLQQVCFFCLQNSKTDFDKTMCVRFALDCENRALSVRHSNSLTYFIKAEVSNAWFWGQSGLNFCLPSTAAGNLCLRFKNDLEVCFRLPQADCC